MSTQTRLLTEVNHLAVLRRHRLKCFGIEDATTCRLSAMIYDRLMRIAS